jgi:hypothetical protein
MDLIVDWREHPFYELELQQQYHVRSEPQPAPTPGQPAGLRVLPQASMVRKSPHQPPAAAAAAAAAASWDNNWGAAKAASVVGGPPPEAARRDQDAGARSPLEGPAAPQAACETPTASSDTAARLDTGQRCEPAGHPLWFLCLFESLKNLLRGTFCFATLLLSWKNPIHCASQSCCFTNWTVDM